MTHTGWLIALGCLLALVCVYAWRFWVSGQLWFFAMGAAHAVCLVALGVAYHRFCDWKRSQALRQNEVPP